MALNNQPAVDIAFPYGVVVSYADLLAFVQAVKVRVGAGIGMGQGGLNYLPQAPWNPLSVTAPGGMTVTIGGTGQRVYTDGWVCDNCIAQSFTVPTAPTTGTRKDLIAIQSNLDGVTTGTQSRANISNTGVQGTVTESLTTDSVSYLYVQGDSSGNAPTPPAGWNSFATILVGTNVTSIVSGNIAILFPTMISQGPTGATGSQGIQGIQGPQGVGFTFLGAYSPATAYVVNNVVTYLNSSYVCIAPTTGVAPPPASEYYAGTSGSDPGHTYWAPFGLQGGTGAQGIQGIQGVQGPSGATVNFRGSWNSGSSYNVLDIVTYNGSSYGAIAPSTSQVPTNTSYWQLLASVGAAGPQGNPGAPGAPGAPGIPGANGTNGTNGVNALTPSYGAVTNGAGSVSIALPAGNWIVEVDLVVSLANASVPIAVTSGSASVILQNNADASGTTNSSGLAGRNTVSGKLVVSASGGQTLAISAGPATYAGAGPESLGNGSLTARAYPT